MPLALAIAQSILLYDEKYENLEVNRKVDLNSCAEVLSFEAASMAKCEQSLFFQMFFSYPPSFVSLTWNGTKPGQTYIFF